MMFGGSPECPRCTKAVYAAEQILGPGRKLYHKPCLTCASCNKRLESFSLREHEEEIYCKICHNRLFGTQDLRSANLPHMVDGLQQPLTRTPTGSPTKPRTLSVPSSPATPRRWGGGGTLCAHCDKTVYHAEEIKAAGKTYHKVCLKCVQCGTMLDATRLRDHNGLPYCGKCHGQLNGSTVAGLRR